LYGSIPTHFGLLTKLRDLWLSDNKLTGGIPAELGNMAELRELTIAANELTGEIPEMLSQATHMHYVALEDNHLKGTIPAVIFSSLTAMGRWRDMWCESNQSLESPLTFPLFP
jgi:Leucine-rich repeat (LRR) protein